MTNARVIVVGNNKGGSGKSTVAMHVAIALIKAGQRVATIDLDNKQKTLTHYVDYRRDWARESSLKLEVPTHMCFETVGGRTSEVETLGRNALAEIVEWLSRSHDFVVIDGPGHDTYLASFAHSLANTLITPLNDSFLDFDVLGTIDARSFKVTGISHYAKMVEEARRQRSVLDQPALDWVVLRNRLSTLGSRNKRLVGEALSELSTTLNFRLVDGLAERVIFREFYPRGLTAIDDVDQLALGARPTMSHVTARLEMERLMTAIMLGHLVAQPPVSSEVGRDAA
ncbi:division plane positioning ATPase MipZ [Bradyrhizobium jicamae]|uniref:division plane positioning ATPase MipZ n=1 Tax=Bradyrhizobium jicamae TaxID=280332 RepID=UPI001BAC1C63|nr:division plane positioning ATPase MipZ [Bradyrhizobium jicamae]MBR0933740.1 AAA family ATPase [Bradyrhizobium jicamae]